MRCRLLLSMIAVSVCQSVTLDSLSRSFGVASAKSLWPFILLTHDEQKLSHAEVSHVHVRVDLNQNAEKN